MKEITPIIVNSLKRFSGDNDLREACRAFLEGFSFHLSTASPSGYKRGSNMVPITSFLLPEFIDKNPSIIEPILSIKYVGGSDIRTFTQNNPNLRLEDVVNRINEERYKGILFFCLDIDRKMKRAEIVDLSRAFNKRFKNCPSVLFIRFSNLITLTTCRRTLSVKKGSDIIGKVSILKDINCEEGKTHPGHIKILEDLVINKDKPSFDEVYDNWLKTFNCELLTKKFYKELSIWHAFAIEDEALSFPNDIKDSDKKKHRKYNQENIIRLVTRLIFVWFLKEKGLIPDELFDEQFIRDNLLKDFDPHHKEGLFFKSTESRYYKAILQNLFFATLNCPIVNENTGEANNRRFCKSPSDSKDSKVMKYEDYFIDPQLFLSLVNRRVPFLNGGLFDCLDHDNRYYFDGFSEDDKISSKLRVPDYLFFGEEVGKDMDLSNYFGDKKRKHSNAKGIIDILHGYKFTVEENTPYDQEVSLDPELLGKVFENLLAEYNPETGSTVRKSSGSYYTPREIVQYMVDESLINHLKRTVDPNLESTYRELLGFSTEEINLPHHIKDSILQSIYNCKILDPACGSGAFPVGMLQQMVHILSRVDPTNEGWRQLMIDVATKRSRASFETTSQEEREEIRKDIYASFDENLNFPDYARKLYLIENCIYGIDIQPIAIQISHLRLFISLIVDQKENPDFKANFGIRPLPNLEAKFVAANSLIPLEKTRNLFSSSPVIMELENKLREANHQIFKARSPQKKVAWRGKLDAYRSSLANAMVEEGFVNSGAGELIKSWDMFDQNSSASFFDPEWMFGITQGFDIVIGNPPYINLSKVPEYKKSLGVYYPEIHTGYNDLMYYFLYLGTQLINDGGISTMITSNYFIGNDYAEKLRSFLLPKMETILNFKDKKIFEAASIHTCISFCRKVSNQNIIEYYEYNGDDYPDTLDLNKDFTHISTSKDKLKGKWIFVSNDKATLMKRLSSIKNLLGDVAIIEQGSKSGCNKVFTVSSDYAESYSFEKQLLRPNVKNSDIDRYIYHDSGDVLIYTDNNTILEEYPHVSQYLLKNETVLSNRNEVSRGLYPWYRFDRPRNKAVFDAEEKIIVPYRAEHNRFAYDNKQAFNDGGDIRAIVLKPNSGYSLKFILGILNSKLIDWFFGYIGKAKGSVREYFNAPLSIIPLPDSTVDQLPIVSLVDEILTAKIIDPAADTSFQEQEIDRLVYDLYCIPDKERLL